MEIERRGFEVEGLVQGVGFRPHVYRVANRHGLRGFVQNRDGSVRIEVEGVRDSLIDFESALRQSAPGRASIRRRAHETLPVRGDTRFEIRASGPDSGGPIAIANDVAPCDACLVELFDVDDRRFRYPFISCTDCGPRFSIVDRAPFDRAATALAAFEPCPRCAAEYADPDDRRFHAQTISCPDCGPAVVAVDAEGGAGDPITRAAERVISGGVIAVRGAGGYHLVCDATCDDAVERLRSLKAREAKPLAVLVGSTEVAARLCELDDTEIAALLSPARPIVLAARRPGAGLAGGVAPGIETCGVGLPATPLHALLAADAGRPIVLTSGNRSRAPIALTPSEARQLGAVDLFLDHDQPIRARLDDSVVRQIGPRIAPMRRARGFVPLPIRLPRPLPAPAIAVGPHMRNTVALGIGDRAVLSQHLGDLDDPASFASFAETIERLEALYRIEPAAVICDLHPDYGSTRYARERARRDGLECIAVQHHHAHLMACLADSGHDGPALGLICDGTGYGTDGAIWGGEVLAFDGAVIERRAHLRYVPMPGRSRAIRQPWRMAVAHLHAAGVDLDGAPWPRSAIEPLVALSGTPHAPPTSSAGRLFDAVAAICGVAPAEIAYDGQPAMQLEALAASAGEVGTYPEASWARLDPGPLIAAIWADVRAGRRPADIARRFIVSLAEMFVEALTAEAKRTGYRHVALGGGVLCNQIFSHYLESRLAARGLAPLLHRNVPPNDGGISLGQLAAATLS